MKTLRELAIITFILISFALIMAWLCREVKATPVIKVVHKKVPMSIRELQIFLNDQHDPWKRYKCDIDGIYGRETAQALDNWLCDQRAVKEFKRYE